MNFCTFDLLDVFVMQNIKRGLCDSSLPQDADANIQKVINNAQPIYVPLILTISFFGYPTIFNSSKSNYKPNCNFYL